MVSAHIDNTTKSLDKTAGIGDAGPTRQRKIIHVVWHHCEATE